VSEDDIYQVLLDEQGKLGAGLHTSNSDNDLLPDNLTEQQRERDQLTTHVYPEDEERHITEIVKTILNNDLQNKIENLKKPGSSTIGEDMSG